MIKVRQLKVSLINRDSDGIRDAICKKLKIKSSEILDFSIKKESIDARDKNNILFVYEVNVNLKNENSILKKNKFSDVSLANDDTYRFDDFGKESLKFRPVVVGGGPCGLFCAYSLAENGYKPLIIERGERVEDRVKSVEEFWKTGKLNVNSNVSFGEGGAGTFSDGKLNTLVKDKFNRGVKVFDTFVKCGAPKEIMYSQKPHIGTDILRKVVINMRKEIVKNGGEFLYNSTLTDIIIDGGKVKKIIVNGKDEIYCDVLVLAIGHSARDTFKMLYNRNIKMVPKAFAVGIRIEHPQSMINYSQYGDCCKVLPAASYKLTYTTKEGRGVYSFCMCPGGYVVNASSEEGMLAINGMSNYNRDSENANSAIVVTVTPDDFGKGVFDGLEFQRKLERLAYRKGNSKIPVQLWKDYRDDVASTKFGDVKPVYKGNFEFANLNDIFPEFINNSLKEAIPYFGTKIDGFDRDDAILAGVESRTSSSLHINRDDNGLCNIDGIYPGGEGAGYAGGITTASMDGIKISEFIMKKYKSF